MKRFQLAIFAILISVFYFGCGNTHIVDIYVFTKGNDLNTGGINSPVKSIERTRKIILEYAEKDRTDKINIIFREGIYPCTSTFLLDDPQLLDGSIQITFQAYEKEKVIFSGGEQIKTWKANKDGNWESNLDESIHFEQLYVNDRMATRARFPNKKAKVSQWFLRKVEYDQDDSGEMKKLEIYLVDAELDGYADIRYGEIVIMKDWATFRKQIDLIVPKDGIVGVRLPVSPPTKKQGAGNSLYSTNRQPGYNAYLEGHPAFVDEEGEWALDKDQNKIIYKPLPGETIESSKIFYPVISKLILVKGSEKNKIRNIHFKNIIFSHTGYWLPERGHDGSQAAMFYTGDLKDFIDDELVLPEAVRLEYAENCSITGCTFSMLGSSGLRLGKGCQHTAISENLFREIGGNCIMSGLKKDPLSDSTSMIGFNAILNNTVSDGGKVYPSGVGIWLGFCHSHEVRFNSVCELPYTGISVGWKWNPLPSSSSNNKIENNHIHHVMKVLGDGGGIYTLGRQPGSTLKQNHIHDIERSQYNHASPNNGMFIDEGSQDYHIEGNLIYNVVGTPIRGHRSAGVTVLNNVLVTESDQPGVSHSPPYGNRIFVFDNTNISWTRPESISAEHYPDTIYAMNLSGNKFAQIDRVNIDHMIDSLDLY